jgi:NADH-quinone oxidoreductase subunit E
MVNCEYFDNQTPAGATQLADRLRAGEQVAPTRGAASVCSFKQMSRVLAGFSDGRADEGVGAGEPTLAGLRLAREHDWTAPGGAAPDQVDGSATDTGEAAAQGASAVGHEQSSAERKPTTPADATGATPDASKGKQP